VYELVGRMKLNTALSPEDVHHIAAAASSSSSLSSSPPPSSMSTTPSPPQQASSAESQSSLDPTTSPVNGTELRGHRGTPHSMFRHDVRQSDSGLGSIGRDGADVVGVYNDDSSVMSLPSFLAADLELPTSSLPSDLSAESQLPSLQDGSDDGRHDSRTPGVAAEGLAFKPQGQRMQRRPQGDAPAAIRELQEQLETALVINDNLREVCGCTCARCLFPWPRPRHAPLSLTRVLLVASALPAGAGRRGCSAEAGRRRSQAAAPGGGSPD
jgi:hypothetical protein